MTIQSHEVSRPWFREPGPWLLMLGPFIVVLAGFYTAYLAIISSDGLVTEDYYKKGLAVDQTIARNERAATLGVVAGLRLTGGEELSLRLAVRDSTYSLPERLHITLSHPTRAGLDQEAIVTRDGELYHGRMRLPASGHWLVLIEDEQSTWRLLGNVVLPAAGETLIGGKQTADIRS